MTFCAIPPRISRDRRHLVEGQAVEHVLLALELGQRGDAAGGGVDGVVGVPRAGGVARAPVERPGGVDVADAAGVQLVGGRLHHHDELVVEPLALEQRRQRAVLARAAPRGRRTGSRTAPRPAPARSSRPARPSCRWPRGRRRGRPRSGRARCPARAPCRGGRPAARARRGGRAGRCRRGRWRRAATRRGRARRASSRDSEGMSISSSVRSARFTPPLAAPARTARAARPRSRSARSSA